MKAVIFDHEPDDARRLQQLLMMYCPKVTVIELSRSVEQALFSFKQDSESILFLNVGQPFDHSFSLMEQHTDRSLSRVVFTTVYQNGVVRLLDIIGANYLLKPFTAPSLRKLMRICGATKFDDVTAMNKPAEDTSTRGDYTISLAEGQEYHIVPLSKIIRLKGSGSYTTFFLDNGKKILVSKRLKLYDNYVAAHGFFRTHQSHIVNAAFVERYSKSNGGYILLKNGETVPVGISKKAGVKMYLGV